MIVALLDLQAFSNAQRKTVSVFAQADAAGMETLIFQILNMRIPKEVEFTPGQGQVVEVEHTVSGTGPVSVTALNSDQSITSILNLDGQLGESAPIRTESYRW